LLSREGVEKDAECFDELAWPAGRVELVALDAANEPVVLVSVGFLTLKCAFGVRRVPKVDADAPAQIIERVDPHPGVVLPLAIAGRDEPILERGEHVSGVGEAEVCLRLKAGRD
jgi:hypothetical protein